MAKHDVKKEKMKESVAKAATKMAHEDKMEKMKKKEK